MVKLTSTTHGGLAAIELVDHGTRLVIVHGVGPRVAWLGAVGGNNLLFWDEAGAHARGEWRLYGGHRLLDHTARRRRIRRDLRARQRTL